MKLGEKLKGLWENKTVRIVLLSVAALLVLFAVYRVFFGNAESGGAAGYVPTEQEERLVHLLTRLEGVDSATVMVTEEDGVAVSAIVFFEGTDGFLTRMRIAEIAASALRIARTEVFVYPAES